MDRRRERLHFIARIGLILIAGCNAVRNRQTVFPNASDSPGADRKGDSGRPPIPADRLDEPTRPRSRVDVPMLGP